MPANDLSLVSGSQIHTGQVGTTYPDTLYNLTGNADLLLKTSSGTILDISTTIGTIPDEINVKELAAEDNSLLVPSKGGDTDYNPSQKLGEVANTDKAAVDPLTGTNYEPPTTITSNNPLEKSADSADLITGDSVQNEDATAPSKTRTGTTDNTNSTDKITETGSEVGITSATEKSLGETVASPDKSSNEITNLETKSSPEKPITWDSETTDSLTGISTTDSPDKSTDSAASKITSETTNSPDTNISNSVESSATTNTENAALSNGETNNEQTIAPLTETATISEIGAEVKEIVTSPSQLTNSVESTATPDLVTGEFVENPTEKSPSNTQITTLSNAEDSQEESLTLSSEETTILPEVKPLLTSEDKPEIRLEITQETVASNGTNSNDLTGSVADKKTEESSSNSASNTPILTTNSPDAHQSGLAEEETKIENHVIENSITNEPKETVAGDKLTTEKPVDTSSEISNTTNTEKNPAVNGGEEEKKAEGEAEVSSDETQKELNPTATQPELTASPDPFTSGKFKVDTTGKVGIDFLFDGGLYQGQLAIFSLKGMAIFIPGSEAFIKEATARALSKSVQGHVVISDLSEGARFSGKLGEENFNSGEYLGVKTFDMTPGDEFGVMIVPNGTVQEVFDNPAIGGNKRPLFSMATANPENGMQIGQIADVTGEGNTFSMEDLRVDGWTDKDYNDFVFQVRGAVGKAVLMDDVVAAGKDWRTSDLGKALVAYAKPYITPEPAEDLETSLSGLLDDLEDVTSPADSLGNGIPTGEKDSPTTGELIEKGSASSDDNSSSILPSEKLDSNPDSQALAGDKEDNITEFAATDVPLKDNSETELTSGKTEEISSNLAALPQGDQTADNLPQTAAVEVEKIDNSGVDSPESSVLPATKSLSHPAITADTKETAVIPASVVNGSVSSASQNIEVAVSPITIVVTPPTKETVTVNSQTQVFVSETLPSFPETEILLHPNTSVKADLISRLESVTETFRNQSVATTSGSNTVSAALIERLENITENLRSQDAPAVVIDNTVALVSRLESMVIKTSPKPVETVQFEFPKVAQPLVGIFNENGFSQDNPKIDYSRITLAKDRVEDDTNPLVSVGEGNNPDTVALAIIEQINKNAPLVVGRAPASSEEWAKSLIEYVDTAKVSGQPNAIVSLNLNFTEVKKDGSITHRYELTQAERDALAYAQKYNVLVVVPAGDDSETMSALGEISLEFNNIMTVGAAKRVNDSVAVSKAYDLANTSGSGYALDILADGSSGETFNTSVAANKVAGAASQVWAANPKLSYRQVVDIIQRTATDLNKPNLDFETGSGLLNIPAAVNLAKVTPAIDTDVPIRWLDVDKKNQPLIGIIDTGFNGKNPDIDYKRIILGRDRVDNDNDPLLGGEGSEHGTHVLGIIGATQGNGIGIDGINDDAPIWLGRAIGSGKWAESLREFVDAAKASGQPKAVVNLSFDLTQTNPDGTVTTRYELTPQERQAIEYARQNGVMIVVAAGNNGGTMSALGQASQEFDNIITVGSINYNGDRADYSSFGYGLDLVARGGTPDEPVPSTVGEGVNLKQMTSDEEPPEDEMSANARTTFEEVFGAFSDGKESENDEQELESLTPEERQVYDEATKEIDQLLKDYLGAASEKIALEYVDGYYGASVDALSNFVDAFDGDLADNLIKAQEILEEAGFKTDTPTETNLDFSIPLDLGIGEMAGTSVAAAKVTGAVSQVWAANPGLSYFQVKEILKQTAVDLNKPGWDLETGAGLVNIAAAVELAKRVQPQAYQPQPIQSPLIWSGEGKVTPGERAVAVSVPTFTGRLMNAGYVTQTGWLRIRSNPGTNFAEVGRKYPGDAIDFDAYEDNGGWVPDPFMPGGGSSRWYKIAGTNNWMSALYFDNTPERAEQERQQQDAIRRAEEEARRAEEEARRAEEELRRIEEEVRRQAEEEQRRRIEEELRRILEEQRRRQEQLQAAISQVTQKVGDLGKAIGSYVNNGVTVYQTERGILLVQSDGRSAFYEAGKKVAEFFDPNNQLTPVGYLKDKFLNSDLKTGLEWSALGLDQGKDLLSDWGKKLSYKAVYPDSNGFVLPRYGIFSNYVDESLGFLSKTANNWEEFLAFNKFNPGKNGFLLPRVNTTWWSKFAKGIGPVGAVIGLAPLAYEYFNASDPTKKREVLVKGGFETAFTMLGGGVGAVVGGAIGGPVGVAVGGFVGGFVGGYLGSLAGTWVNDNWDTTLKPLTKPIEDGFNAVSSFTSNTFEAAKKKAEETKQKAQELAVKAKTAYEAAKANVQQAKASYQTFKQEIQKQTTQIVQQSQQKLKEAAQKVFNKVVQNPVVQQGAKVVKQIANYAQKAVKTVGNIINGAKQLVNNVIDTGKQIVNNVIETGKKAYQEVKNFVVNTYETGKKVVTETYNKAAEAVNTVKNTISNGFNAVKSFFGR